MTPTRLEYIVHVGKCSVTDKKGKVKQETLTRANVKKNQINKQSLYLDALKAASNTFGLYFSLVVMDFCRLLIYY